MTKTAQTEFYIFNPKGLDKAEIAVLTEVEKLYFEGVKQSFNDMFLPAFKAAGFYKGCPEAKKCLDAWHYWEFIKHPYDRESYKTPRSLSEVFTTLTNNPVEDNEYSDKRPKSFYISTPDHVGLHGIPNMEYLNGIDNISLLYDFTPQYFYFKIVNDCLYLEYQQIIGSRFICVIKSNEKE